MGIFTSTKSVFTSTGASPLTKDHQARATLFKTYWNYYRGRHRKNLKIKPNEPDDNVTLNYSRKIVNQGVNFLFGKPVTFHIDEDVEGRTPEEAILDSAWADDPLNDFSMVDFLQECAMYGAMTGTPFIRLYPADSPHGRAGKASFVNIDPSMVDVITSADDKRHVNEYHIIWKSSDVWLRDRFVKVTDESWEIAREEYGRAGEWRTTEDVVTWDYSWSPIFHCQNLKNPLDFWGISDLEDADLNDAVNFTASNNGRIIRFHAHPKTVLLGADAKQIQLTAADGLWAIPNAEAKVNNLEMQSDLNASREHQRMLTGAFHQVSDVPMLDEITTQVGALSGFALQILYGALLGKTESKRRRYGGMLSRLNNAVLQLEGAEIDGVVTNKWDNPLPSSDKEKAELFSTYVSSGATLYAAAKLAGYSEKQARMIGERGRVLAQDQIDVPTIDVGDAQEFAPLNGAQGERMIEVLERVTTGALPPRAAELALKNLGVIHADAIEMVKDAKANGIVGEVKEVTGQLNNGTASTD